MTQIREDILTSKERVLAFLEGKPLDRVLCMPIVTSNASLLIDENVRNFQLDPEVMADSYIAAYKKYKYDLNYLFTNCSFIAEAMGASLVYSDEEPANCEEHIIQDKSDLEKIKVAESNDGLFTVFYKALDIVNEKIGDEVFSSICFSGPVSTAATLRGTEAFVRDAYRDPELCHNLLRMSTDSCKNFIKEIVAHGGIPIILEPIASGSIFSPRMFKKFAFPYIKELVDYAHDLGALIPLHICGKTHKIIDQMTDTGADIISIDICDLEIAKEKVGGRAPILGNVDPANVLLFGPINDIKKVCEDSIEIMKDYKGGYVLSTGCETSTKVPFEHIQEMLNVARSYGKYDYTK